jgi:hypothetical protein
LQHCTVRLFPQVHALTPYASSRRRRRSHCTSPQALVHVVCGAGVWLPHRYTCAGRCSCVLHVAQACGCPHRHTCAGRFTKGAAFSAQRYPAATVSRRMLALTGIHAAFERHPPPPPPVGPTPRSRPHCDELPNRGQGEYRVVNTPEPGTGAVTMWTLGLPGGAWPLARRACPVRAAGATPLIKSVLTYAMPQAERLRKKHCA